MLKMTRGDDRRLRGTVRAEGVAADLTGYTIWFTAKRKISDTDAEAVIRLNSDSLGGVAFDTEETGVFYVLIAASLTADLPDTEATNLLYDLQIQTPAGLTQTLAKSILRVEYDITRAV